MPRTTVGALALALFLLVAPPVAAKGPTHVEVRNLQTGTTTTLTMNQPELAALTELVGWPARRSRPEMVRNGTFTHVATLSWGFDDGQSAWLDRVFSDGSGTTWIARRDHLSGNTFDTWGRVRAAYTLDLLLAQLGEVLDKTISPSTSAAAQPARASATGLDGSSFGWGAAAAAFATLLVGGVGVRLRRARP